MAVVPSSRARTPRGARASSAALAITTALTLLGWSGPAAAAESAPVRMVIGSLQGHRRQHVADGVGDGAVRARPSW